MYLEIKKLIFYFYSKINKIIKNVVHFQYHEDNIFADFILKIMLLVKVKGASI
jgi:hypothetical protein